MKKRNRIVWVCAAITLLAGCAQIDQAGVALIGPALSPAPPTATPRPVTPTAPPPAVALPAALPAPGEPITATNASTLADMVTLPGAIGPFTRLAFNATGTRLAATDYDGFVQLWNLEDSTVQVMAIELGEPTPDPRGEMRSSPPGRVPYGALTFTADGAQVLSVGPNFARSWTVADNSLLAASELSDGGNFEPDGSVSLSNSSGLLMARGGMKGGFNNYRAGMVRIWDLSGEAHPIDLEGHTGWVQALAFDPSGEILATTGSDHRLLLWDVQQATLLLEINSITRRPNVLRFDPTGARIACADHEGMLRLWDTHTGAPLGELDAGAPIYSAAFSPDGALLAAIREDGVIHVWEATSEALLVTLAAGEDAQTPRAEFAPVPGLTFSPDGTLLVSLDPEGRVHLWGISGG